MFIPLSKEERGEWDAIDEIMDMEDAGVLKGRIVKMVWRIIY